MHVDLFTCTVYNYVIELRESHGALISLWNETLSCHSHSCIVIIIFIHNHMNNYPYKQYREGKVCGLIVNMITSTKSQLL